MDTRSTDGQSGLVSAQYFHTPDASPRTGVLRIAPRALCPDKFLWSSITDPPHHGPGNQGSDPHFPDPAEVATGLEPDPARWSGLSGDTPAKRPRARRRDRHRR